jgi:hypothetical protein
MLRISDCRFLKLETARIANHDHFVEESLKRTEETAFGEGAEHDRRGAYTSRNSQIIRNLFEELFQVLKHNVFFVRAHAISEKELLAQVQCSSFHCRGIKLFLIEARN